MEQKYNENDYYQFVRDLHPDWRPTTVQDYADRLIGACEMIGITLKDFVTK